MSINSIVPTELARHRQNVNPVKSTLTSSHGLAYKGNRDKVANKEIAVLENLDVDSEAYYDDLLN